MGRKRVSKQLEPRGDWLWLSSESITWWVVCVRNCWACCRAGGLCLSPAGRVPRASAVNAGLPGSKREYKRDDLVKLQEAWRLFRGLFLQSMLGW